MKVIYDTPNSNLYIHGAPYSILQHGNCGKIHMETELSPEIQFADSLNGFDYEVTQSFVCGSLKTGEPSKYVNRLLISKAGTLLLDTFWEGTFSNAYLRMKAREEVSWFIENQDLFIFMPRNCEFRLDHKYSRAYKEMSNQPNALRIETGYPSDRCSLKTSNYKNKKLIFPDIVNGFHLNFGYCSGNCPKRCRS